VEEGVRGIAQNQAELAKKVDTGFSKVDEKMRDVSSILLAVLQKLGQVQNTAETALSRVTGLGRYVARGNQSGTPPTP